jgi:hypothetical protein
VGQPTASRRRARPAATAAPIGIRISMQALHALGQDAGKQDTTLSLIGTNSTDWSKGTPTGRLCSGSRLAAALLHALRPEGFRVDLAEFLAHEYPGMNMKDAIAGIASKAVRAQYEDAHDHPPPRENVEKAQAAMGALGTQYREAFRQQNIVAIAHPTESIPAPLLPTEGDALPATFEIHGRRYPNTVVPRNTLVGPVYRAPGLSIPAAGRMGCGPLPISRSPSSHIISRIARGTPPTIRTKCHAGGFLAA